MPESHGSSRQRGKLLYILSSKEYFLSDLLTISFLGDVTVSQQQKHLPRLYLNKDRMIIG